MDRQIKFRAWDKVEKVMLPYDEFCEVYSFSESARLDFWLQSKDFELMQFTGLLDKNGKEIYEGDIIEFKKGVGNLWAGQEGRKIVKFPFLCGNSDLGEIIGDIYSHPELLTK